MAEFIDDLSNWYVRRSRRRFWEGDACAMATLHTALHTLTTLMAPFVPFVTERVWRDLFATDATDSVHLQSWPVAADGSVAGTLDDDTLLRDMRMTRTLVELGRAARASANAKTRQPLACALVTADGFDQLNPELVAELADELNVQQVLDGRSTGDLTDVQVRANFRSLGARFAQRTPVIAGIINALGEHEAANVVASLRATGTAQITVEGKVEDISAHDVTVTETARSGWAVAADHGVSIALDTNLTDVLRALGAARDVVRALQEARKNAGFGVSDRISVNIHATDSIVARAIAEHGSTIAADVLAVQWHVSDVPVSDANLTDEELTLSAHLHVIS